MSNFNLQNGSSTLNTGRSSLLNGSYSPEKLDLAALSAQKLGLPLRLPKVRCEPAQGSVGSRAGRASKLQWRAGRGWAGERVLFSGGAPGGAAGQGTCAADRQHQCVAAASCQVFSSETILATRCKRTYANAHTYHINSIALSSDMETFISGEGVLLGMG